MGRFQLVASLLLVVANIWPPSIATAYAIDKFYANLDSYSDTPNAVRAHEPDTCTEGTCFTDGNFDNGTTECTSEYLETMKESFGTSQYVIQVVYTDSSCTTFYYAVGYRVTGSCELGYVAVESYYEGLFFFIASLPEEGTAQLEFFTTLDCSVITDSSTTTDIGAVAAPKTTLESGECVPLDYSSYLYKGTGYTRWCSSNSSDGGGGVTTGAIIGVTCIHRDLKSRNILLNQSREAKLTDFCISNERIDRTMTAGVGTSLWMAPEVMLGEKYDVKADVFSFGVVLSELDVHTLPYAQTKQRSLDTTATLLQKITAGEARVEF
ncbi:hypothetical protein PInf_014149 [Phytophthora infestans]|nr:hypothetical protein PInf_014149 [Phytophthora infestans]